MVRILSARTKNSSIFPRTAHFESSFWRSRSHSHSSNTNISESFHKSVPSDSLCHTDFLWKWFPNGIFAEWTSNFWTEKSDPLYSCIDLRGSVCACFSHSPIWRNRESIFLRTMDEYGKSVKAWVAYWYARADQIISALLCSDTFDWII